MNIQTYDDQIERALLSIMLTDPKTIDECSLDSKHFVNPVNRRAYEIFKKYYAENGAISIGLMCAEVKDAGQFVDYCMALSDEYISSSNFHFLMEKQEEAYKKNQIIKIADALLEGKASYSEVVDSIRSISSEFVNVNDYHKPKPQEIYDLITTDRAKIRFRDLDCLNRVGLLENTLNVIAARPSVGKTGFALNMINDLSDRYKCIYLNMEMTEKEIYERLAAINSAIPINRFTKLETNEINKLNNALTLIYNKKIKIYNGSKSFKAVRAILTREQREGHCIIFIDHIGYVTTGKRQSDTERIGEAVREIQKMTKDLNVTVFLLAHINRAGTDAPTVNFLKDSGELEQSAHVVMLLHNPNDDLDKTTSDIQLIVDKNRSGKRGKIDLEYQKTTQIFREKRYAR